MAIYDISNNKRETNKKTYYTTADPNVIAVLWTAQEEIHLSKLKEKKAGIEALIAAPSAKSAPDEECLTFWNDMNVADTADLQAQFDEIDAILAELAG